MRPVASSRSVATPGSQPTSLSLRVRPSQPPLFLVSLPSPHSPLPPPLLSPLSTLFTLLRRSDPWMADGAAELVTTELVLEVELPPKPWYITEASWKSWTPDVFLKNLTDAPIWACVHKVNGYGSEDFYEIPPGGTEKWSRPITTSATAAVRHRAGARPQGLGGSKFKATTSGLHLEWKFL